VLTVDEVFQDLLKYRPFIKSGGLTVSGGEPLVQTEFLEELLSRCKSKGIHTAVDTSGIMPVKKIERVLDLTDLVILDIKALEPDLCRKISGSDNKNALELLDYLEVKKKPTWIRHVVVPGYTDVLDDLSALAKFLKSFSCIEKIELLPFHQMALHKWESLRFPYALGSVEPPSKEFMEKAEDLFK
jgi:pyruvate formate lyase activating enzyme